MSEGRLSRVAPTIVGVLLVLESAALLMVAVFVGIIGGLVGGLAIGVGAGSATDEQFAKGIAAIVLTIVSPFVVAAAVGFAGVLLLLRMWRRAVIAAGVFAIGAQFALHLALAEGFHPAQLVFGALHLLAIAVAFALLPAPITPPPAVTTAST